MVFLSLASERQLIASGQPHWHQSGCLPVVSLAPSGAIKTRFLQINSGNYGTLLKYHNSYQSANFLLIVVCLSDFKKFD